MTWTLVAEIVGILLGVAIIYRGMRFLHRWHFHATCAERFEERFNETGKHEDYTLMTRAKKNAEKPCDSFLAHMLIGMLLLVNSLTCLVFELWLFPDVFKHWNR